MDLSRGYSEMLRSREELDAPCFFNEILLRNTCWPMLPLVARFPRLFRWFREASKPKLSSGKYESLSFLLLELGFVFRLL